MGPSQKKRAIFLDRDGVINIDKQWIIDKKNFELYPGVGDAICNFRKQGFVVCVVTNQSVVARGLITEAEMQTLHGELQKKILAQNSEALVDKFYFCPHHPHGELTQYRKTCECRKPRPGMLRQAETEWNLDLTKSFMVGDRITDMVAGSLAGCSTVLVESGAHEDKAIVSDLPYDPDTVPISHRVPSLWEFSNLL